jgi:hypothetical protein
MHSPDTKFAGNVVSLFGIKVDNQQHFSSHIQGNSSDSKLPQLSFRGTSWESALCIRFFSTSLSLKSRWTSLAI